MRLVIVHPDRTAPVMLVAGGRLPAGQIDGRYWSAGKKQLLRNRMVELTTGDELRLVGRELACMDDQVLNLQLVKEVWGVISPTGEPLGNTVPVIVEPATPAGWLVAGALLALVQGEGRTISEWMSLSEAGKASEGLSEALGWGVREQPGHSLAVALGCLRQCQAGKLDSLAADE